MIDAENDDASFEELGLGPEILKDLEALSFERPTPIQVRAIPVALEGHDIVGIAQTGTGKTAAFVLPIVQQMEPGQGTRALVLSPTRELAEQTYDASITMGKTKGISAVVIIGGERYGAQDRALEDGVDIVVGTPGRVLDQIQRGKLQVNGIQFVVLDEGDRLLDMGFAPQLNDIFRHLPTRRQTMLFSATMPPKVQALARTYQYEPKEVAVGPRHKAVEGCVQELYVVTEREKPVVAHYLVKHEQGSVLVFTRTRRGADHLYRHMTRTGQSVAVLHADRTQEERRRALQQFRDGERRVLVATDIASRGLDVEGIARVINFDVPPTQEDYLHRIGRTARAERTGHASTLATIEDLQALRSIEAGLDDKIPSVVIPRDELNSFARELAALEYDNRGQGRGGDRQRRHEGGGGRDRDRDRPRREGSRGSGESRGGRPSDGSPRSQDRDRSGDEKPRREDSGDSPGPSSSGGGSGTGRRRRRRRR